MKELGVKDPFLSRLVYICIESFTNISMFFTDWNCYLLIFKLFTYYKPLIEKGGEDIKTEEKRKSYYSILMLPKEIINWAWREVLSSRCYCSQKPTNFKFLLQCSKGRIVAELPALNQPFKMVLKLSLPLPLPLPSFICQFI